MLVLLRIIVQCDAQTLMQQRERRDTVEFTVPLLYYGFCLTRNPLRVCCRRIPIYLGINLRVRDHYINYIEEMVGGCCVTKYSVPDD